MVRGRGRLVIRGCVRWHWVHCALSVVVQTPHQNLSLVCGEQKYNVQFIKTKIHKKSNRNIIIIYIIIYIYIYNYKHVYMMYMHTCTCESHGMVHPGSH